MQVVAWSIYAIPCFGGLRPADLTDPSKAEVGECTVRQAQSARLTPSLISVQATRKTYPTNGSADNVRAVTLSLR